MKAAAALKLYLTDIKNLAVHAAIGVAILLTAFVIPVSVPLRIGILALVVAGNILRMRFSKKQDRKEEPEGLS